MYRIWYSPNRLTCVVKPYCICFGSTSLTTLDREHIFIIFSYYFNDITAIVFCQSFYYSCTNNTFAKLSCIKGSWYLMNSTNGPPLKGLY